MSEQPAGTVIAGYRVESVIGRGGMAVVHRAEDTRLGRKVALKVLTPWSSDQQQFRQRFIRESRLAASLDHPNIIPIYDAGDADGLLFIAMRYVVGTDLKVALSGDRQLAPGRTLRLFTQIAAALDAAHESGLVHRDVKPANVLLTSFHGQTDHVYLTDFGLTKRTSSLTGGGLTATGHFLGTIDYVAPEQIAGKPVDVRADIYALGCMLYESLTGRVPFSRDDDAAVLWAHLVETPPPVTALRGEVAPAVDAVVARAMAKVPEERYGSGQELITDLEEALQVAAPVREGRALVRIDTSPGLDAADLEHEQETRPPTQHPSFPPKPVLTAGPTSHRRAASGPRRAPDSRRRPPSRRRVAGFASAAVLLVAAVAAGFWFGLHDRTGTPASGSAGRSTSSSSSASQPQNHLLAALAMANQVPDARLPPKSCHPKPGTTTDVVCMHPNSNVQQVEFREYPSLKSLYAAYMAKVKSALGRPFQQNFGKCRTYVASGEGSWTHTQRHLRTLTVKEVESGNLTPDAEVGGRFFCHEQSDNTLLMIWTQNAGNLLATASGAGSHPGTYQWWTKIHHDIPGAQAPGGMHMPSMSSSTSPSMSSASSHP